MALYKPPASGYALAVGDIAPRPLRTPIVESELSEGTGLIESETIRILVGQLPLQPPPPETNIILLLGHGRGETEVLAVPLEPLPVEVPIEAEPFDLERALEDYFAGEKPIYGLFLEEAEWTWSGAKG